MSLTTTDLIRILSSNRSQEELDDLAGRISTTRTNGIEGLPYQFPKTVDARITNTELGRKYAEKIFSRLPLLFLTPCKPLFMPDFSDQSRKTVIQSLVGLVGGQDALSLVSGSGRYYSTEFDYNEYYTYLNTMLTCVSAYLGIFDERLTIPGTGIENRAIGRINWQDELNSDFKTFFTASENLIFYLDSFDSVSESVSNDTTESSIASQINGFTDQLNEIKFLIGNDGQSTLSAALGGAGEVTQNITSAFSGALESLGGGIVGSLSKQGVNSIFEGGKIIFPEIWSNSDYSKSFNLEIKLRSPDNDNLSIFLNIIKPYCKLLTLGLPRQVNSNGGEVDQNAYGAPFLVRAYSKGMFNIDMGIISSMTINKGATAQWNDDGLPTQLDITLEIKDLYGKFAMSKADGWAGTGVLNVVNNTAYMDFLANLSGLNVGQMEMARRVRLGSYLLRAVPARAEAGVFTKFDQSITHLIGKAYRTF